jgi:CubicO group peptidase (beta-lactamase class C family)
VSRSNAVPWPQNPTNPPGGRLSARRSDLVPRILTLFLLPSFLACASVPPRIARDATLLGERYAMYGFAGVVLVAKDGRVLIDRGFGVADRQTRAPMRANTSFDAGSIMKTFVAAAVLRLEAEGRLRTSDPISRYLGEMPADKNAITIDHLLLHTSGLPLDVPEQNVRTVDDLVETLRRTKLQTTPGATYAYSNFGYGIAAVIVERVAGEPFAAYSRRHLLDPARMRDSRFWTEPPRPSETMAMAYSGSSDEELESAAVPQRTAPQSPMWGKYVFGAGGIVTTAGDLHRWFRALQTYRILPPPAARKMFTPVIEGQSYGWNIRGEKIYRGGLIRGSFLSMLASHRDLGAEIIYLTNRNTGWHAPLEKNLERALRGEPPLVPPAVIDAAPAIADGVYGDVRIARDGNDLLVAGESQEALSLLWSMMPERREVAERMNARVRAIPEKLRAAGSLANVEILGTAPHPSSPRNYQTFVRATVDGAPAVLRVISDGEKVLAVARGVPPAAMRRFRVTGAQTLASYDPATDAVVTMTVRGDALEIANPSGERIVRTR